MDIVLLMNLITNGDAKDEHDEDIDVDTAVNDALVAIDDNEATYALEDSVNCIIVKLPLDILASLPDLSMAVTCLHAKVLSC